jgi:hypothetical protein
MNVHALGADAREASTGNPRTENMQINRMDRTDLVKALTISARFAISVLLLQCATSCTQPQLIEKGKLNKERIDEIVERASYASGLRVTHPLSVQLIDRTELGKILQEEEKTTIESDAWVTKQAGQSAMAFPSEAGWAIGEDLALLARTVAGLYLPGKKTLYIIGGQARSARGDIYINSFGTLGDEVTLTHEVIHALQHLHYPEFFEPDKAVWPQQTDATLALKAAIEGDATLWAAQSFGFLGSARDPEKVLESSREKFGPLSDAPPLVRESASFPYTYGYRFAYHEGKLGLRSPPASTEQIIHLKRNGRRAFQAIDLSDFARVVETEGCRVLYQDTMGELTLSLWLRSFNSTITQSVWDGWDGDRWIAAECKAGREVSWLTSWDTEEDALEFERTVTGIAAAVQERANLKSSLTVERWGREVVVASGGLWTKVGDLQRLAHRARVTTRAELAQHSASAR